MEDAKVNDVSMEPLEKPLISKEDENRSEDTTTTTTTTTTTEEKEENNVDGSEGDISGEVKPQSDESGEVKSSDPEIYMNWLSSVEKARTMNVYEIIKKTDYDLNPEAQKKFIVDYVWKKHTRQSKRKYKKIEDDDEHCEKKRKENGWKEADDAARKLVEMFDEELVKIPTWDELPQNFKRDEIENRMYPVDNVEEERRAKELKTPDDEEKKYTYDYVVIFRLLKKVEEAEDEDGEKKEKRTKELMKIIEILDYLHFGGLKTFLYKSKPGENGDGMLICLLGCTESRLMLEADRIEFDVELDPYAIYEQGLDTDFALCHKMREYANQKTKLGEDGNSCCRRSSPNFLPSNIFQKTFGAFKDFAKHEEEEMKKKSRLYLRYDDTPFRRLSFFSELSRLKITQYIIEADTQFSGAQLKLAYYARTKSHPAIAFFAMHEPTDQKRVTDKFNEDGALLKDMCLCSREIHTDPEPDKDNKFLQKLNDDPDPIEPNNQDTQGDGKRNVKVSPSPDEGKEIETVDYNNDSFFYSNNPSLPKCCGISHSKMHWEIRNYFGENVALYFAFLSFYSATLIPVAIFGVIVFIPQYLHDNELTILNFVFGGVMVIWTTLFLEMWKREESKLRAYWGMSNFKSKESVRPEFEGELKINLATGELEESVSEGMLYSFRGISMTTIIFFLAAVIGIVIGLLVAKITILTKWGTKDARGMMIPPVLNGVAIFLLNTMYGMCSGRLTDLEKHKTESRYENSKIAKSFVFKMINSYNSLLIIAFVKGRTANLGYCVGSYRSEWMNQFPVTPGDFNASLFTLWRTGLDSGSESIPKQPPFNTSVLSALSPGINPSKACSTWTYWGSGGCDEVATSVCTVACPVYESMKTIGWDNTGNCFQELMLQLSILFGMQIVVGNIMEVGIPMLMERFKAKGKPELSVAEKAMFQSQYPGTFGDYDEILVQFGYVTLFVVAMPLAPLFALLANLLEFLVDGTKIMKLTRRPYPLGAYDIGAWFTMLTVLAYMGIVINIALLTLTESPVLNKETFGADFSTTRLGTFLVIEHFCVLVKFAMGMLIPDKPGAIFDHVQRQEYTTDVLIGR